MISTFEVEMAEKPRIAKNLEKAYAAFRVELLELVSVIQKLPDNPSTLSVEACAELKNHFHKIRGGAGFFTLNELSQVSRLLEEQLKARIAGGTLKNDEFRELLKRFIEVTGELDA